DDLSARVVLLGEFHSLRYGPQERSGRQTDDQPTNGNEKAGGHRGRGYWKSRLRNIREGRRDDRQDSRPRRRPFDWRSDGEIDDEGTWAGGRVQPSHASRVQIVWIPRG